MKKRILHQLRTLLMMTLLCTLFPGVSPVYAADNSATVTSSSEFMSALSQKKSPILVDGAICIGDDADSTGRMLPIHIPGNTVITGTNGSSINSRSPLQLDGDSVVIRDIELTFDSSDALGSVPHREIFLAGHSLTLDNVSTYLPGNTGSLGSLGGSEEELLPTVYAGGYPQTSVSNNASLTVTNSNAKTMLKGIYMSHGAESDNKVPYTGNAVLNLDTKVIVREPVDSSSNAQATIKVSGTGYAKTKSFLGNTNTTFTLEQSSMYEARLSNIGNLVLDNEGMLVPATEANTFSNVTLKNNACLDLSEVPAATIQGNFTGSSENKGILVLDDEGLLTIEGTVSGVTQFQTGDRNFPGRIYSGRQYIKAAKNSETDFILSQQTISNGYELRYETDSWYVYRTDQVVIPEIGGVEIVSAPSTVDLEKITGDSGSIPDSNIYMEMNWYDREGNPISREDLEAYLFYEYNRIIIKTDYLNSTDPAILTEHNWGNALSFETSETNPAYYYLRAEDTALAGNYTFLFFTTEIPDAINNGTVQSVQDCRSAAKAECQITFVKPDTETGEEDNPTPDTPEDNPDNKPENNPSDNPDNKTENPSESEISAPHVHNYVTQVTKASPNQDGSIKKICTECNAVAEEHTLYRPVEVILSKDVYVYNRKLQTPSVIVKDSSGQTVDAGSYTIAYSNNKNAGNATIILSFQGNYEGTLTKDFTILPKPATMSNVSRTNKGLVIKWKKQTSQINGYIIQYSTSKKFTKKTTKTVTVKGNKTTKQTIHIKEPKKTYYVRMCTYKTTKVNGKKQKIYSNWSKTKKL